MDRLHTFFKQIINVKFVTKAIGNLGGIVQSSQLHKMNLESFFYNIWIKIQKFTVGKRLILKVLH
jgi:hypothetical protein